MKFSAIVATSLAFSFAGLALSMPAARADGDINKVNHIVIVMQENHSFDNYFGVLPYVPGGGYHNAGPSG
jgi:phospholipase C